MKKLSDKARLYARLYGQTPYGQEIEGTAELLLQIADKLEDYEDLEEQGKLLKLPVAVGDTVYRIHKGTKLSPDRIYECKVVGVKQEYNTLSVKLHANINEETYSIWVDNWFDKCQIGNEFFLTEEATEAALKEISE